MIEIKETETSGEFELVVDGVAASKREVDLEAHDVVPRKPLFTADIHDPLLKQKVIAHRFSDWPNSLLVLVLNFDADCVTNNVRKGIRITPFDMHRAIEMGVLNTDHTVSFDFDFDIENWKHLWSVREYVEECERIFKQKSPAGLLWGRRGHTSASNGFSFYAHKSDKGCTIESEISKHTEAVCELLELTEASLVAKLRSDSVVMYFDFPEEVRVPCEQYLVYFAQFLRDLGVETDTALTHEAGQVLFTVTPADKEQALDKIRAALEIYLRLSASPINDSSVLNKEIAVQRLVGEIQSLQSRLTLARAEIQFKDKTIEAQQFIIDRQRLSGDVMVESLKNVTPKPPDEDKEAVLGGIVEITKYEGTGINVNFAEVFRRLREYLAKKRKGTG